MLQVTGPPAPETLNQNQAARRHRIIRTALRALASSDYEQVKISDVARDSGVALGTLYRYFASKEHLFAAVFVEWQKALTTKLEKSPLQRVRQKLTGCGKSSTARYARSRCSRSSSGC